MIIARNSALGSGKARVAYSGTLSWKIPWMEEPGRLQSMGSWRVGHDWSEFTFTLHFHALEKEMATHCSVLAWRIPGMAEPGELLSMGSHRVGHNWSDLAAAAAAALGYFPIWTFPGLRQNVLISGFGFSVVLILSVCIFKIPKWNLPAAGTSESLITEQILPWECAVSQITLSINLEISAW